jgi:hypothetical protein
LKIKKIRRILEDGRRKKREVKNILIIVVRRFIFYALRKIKLRLSNSGR